MKNILKHRNWLIDAKIQDSEPTLIKVSDPTTAIDTIELPNYPIASAPQQVKDRIGQLVKPSLSRATEKLLIRSTENGATARRHPTKLIKRRSEKVMDRWLIDLVYTLGILATLLIFRWLLLGRP